VATHYERHAALEQEVCRRLLERCDFLRLPPKRILDLGCGPGQGSEALKRRFRKAQVIGLDFAPTMLLQLRRRSRLLKPLLAVCGDIARLPFARASMDMLFSNLANQWSADLSALFDEYRYVLHPDGMLLFATLGPGSLADFTETWAALDASVSVAPLPDLLEVGNALMAAGFREPVMDMERITVDYPDLHALARELEFTGTSMLVQGWGGWKAVEPALERALSARRSDGRLSVTYEIVYGTAFGPPEGQPRRTTAGEVATISVDSLLKSRPMG
jgi:malonyl-CoA O-methyltransferase